MRADRSKARRRSRGLGLLAAAAVSAQTLLAASPTARAETAATPPLSPAGQLQTMEALYPPWQKDGNSAGPDRGLVFTVAPVDDLADFHGDATDPALVLFCSGNYYFAMAPLVKAFSEANPRYAGKVYYETLPPGLLLQQIAAGGRVTVGNMTWTVKPDVLQAELKASQKLATDGKLVGEIVPFATNDLTIMVPKGNPAHIESLADLARPDVALAMPNPAFEGVAQQIRASLVKVGGETLAGQVYDAKVKSGVTILTRIHHRQTPLLLMQGQVQAGVTWTSEAIFQEEVGHPIAHVAIPPGYNTRAIYSAAQVAGAPHTEAVQVWLAFLKSETAFHILEHYGFKRYNPGAE